MWLTFFISLVISAITTLVVMLWYRRKGWLDDPTIQSHGKIVHITPVPRGGGIPIFLTLLFVGVWIIGVDKHFLGIILGALVLVVVGVFDDLFDINPYTRIVTGVLASLCVVGAGIGIAYVTNPFGATGSVIRLDSLQIPIELLGETRTIWVWADLFAVIWIVWSMNIINWSKGVDGQMPGFVSIAALIIGLFSMRFSGDITQWPVIHLAAITAGAYAGFLVWNAYPQKIMPGYGGGSLAGYLLAILGILSGAKVATLILVLGIPMLDATYTISRRLLKGKSPVWGDRGHLHHRLLDAGWSKKKIAYFYWGSTAVIGAISLQLNSTQKIFSIIMLALLVGAGLVWLKFVKNSVRYE